MREVVKKLSNNLWKALIGPIRSPGKFSRPFIRPCKQIYSLLAGWGPASRKSIQQRASKFPHPSPLQWQISSRRHFHISHNAPFCFLRFCVIYFSFLLGIIAVPGESKNNAYPKFWRAAKVYMGDVQVVYG